MSDRYAAVGVRLDTAEEAKRRISELAAGTRTSLALGQLGAFGGMVRVPAGYTKPVLVLSTEAGAADAQAKVGLSPYEAVIIAAEQFINTIFHGGRASPREP